MEDYKKEWFYVVRSWNMHYFSMDTVKRVYWGNGITKFHKLDLATAMKIHREIENGCTVYHSESMTVDRSCMNSTGCFKGGVEIIWMEVKTIERKVDVDGSDAGESPSPAN